jgi:hypothetical protein
MIFSFVKHAWVSESHTAIISFMNQKKRYTKDMSMAAESKDSATAAKT